MTDLPSDLTEALADHHLTPFEHRDVVRSKVEIPGAAGGLHEAMKVAPVELHHGQTVYLVMECTVGKVRFDPVKDTDLLERVHVLKPTEEGTAFVDKDDVERLLAAAADNIRRAREKASGISRLPIGDDAPGDEYERGGISPIIEARDALLADAGPAETEHDDDQPDDEDEDEDEDEDDE